MTFIDRTNSSALQKKKNRAVQEYLHVQKFQSKLDENHFVPHCINYNLVSKMRCFFFLEKLITRSRGIK
jgi:hypothetical protein